MAEYIEREALKKIFIDHYADEYPTSLILAVIDNVPAADVEEVRHGKWIASDKYFSYYQYKCSNCGCDDYTQTDRNGQCKLMSYCPHCGAKMDLGDDE